ncbi:MAG: GNAT family N-acetyltransferase [Chloroflexi bacterium]|nr:GNAT family N-acetyltransferase [Chloroflexota bacterium]
MFAAIRKGTPLPSEQALPRFTPLFRGRLVRLAAPLPSDHDAFARWSEDDQYLRILDNDPARPLSPEAHAAWETPFLSAPNGYVFRLRTLADDTLIGLVALGQIEWTHQTAMLGIAIGDPAYWGRGYGSDAIDLILRYAFLELNLYRVWLTTIGYNVRALRAYEKAGFKPEGVWREAIHRDDHRYDVVHFGLLRHEWQAHRTATSTMEG